jgi:hypothetical protein
VSSSGHHSRYRRLTERELVYLWRLVGAVVASVLLVACGLLVFFGTRADAAAIQRAEGGLRAGLRGVRVGQPRSERTNGRSALSEVKR